MRHQDRGWLHCKLHLLFLLNNLFSICVWLDLHGQFSCPCLLLSLLVATSQIIIIIFAAVFLWLSFSARDKKRQPEIETRKRSVCVSQSFFLVFFENDRFFYFFLLQNLLMMIPCDFFLGWKMTRSKDIESITANTAGVFFSFSSSGPFSSSSFLWFLLRKQVSHTFLIRYWLRSRWYYDACGGSIKGDRHQELKLWLWQGFCLFLWVRFPLTLCLFLQIEKREKKVKLKSVEAINWAEDALRVYDFVSVVFHSNPVNQTSSLNIGQSNKH